jgi:hypothetical protein
MPTAASNLRYSSRAARRRRIDPRIFRAQINQESHGADVTSPAGAQGPAQLMPATARSLGVDPHKDRQAIDAAARLMADYVHQYHGNYKKALAAYNAGPGAVAKYGGVPPFAETRNYVKSILGSAGGAPSGGGSGGGGTPATFGVDIGHKNEFDAQGFQRAQSGFLVGQLLAKNHGTGGPLFKSGLLTTTAPQRQDFMSQVLTSKITRTGGGGGGGGNPGSALSRAVAQSRTKQPYQWGGGHGGSPAPIGTSVDCSGYWSQILGVSPRTSGQFMHFGKAGEGKNITIYANSGHILGKIRDPRSGKWRWFATSHSNPGGGAGEIAPPSKAYLSKFVARHPGGH